MKVERIIPQIVISAIGSWLFATIFGVLTGEKIVPVAVSGWIFTFLLVLFLESQRLIRAYDIQPQHLVIQGEDIDYSKYNFQEMPDNLDETGITIVNKNDWRLVFGIESGRSGDYMSNIRFRKASPHAQGRIRFYVECGSVTLKENIFNIEEYKCHEYSYLDNKFYYTGRGGIKAIIEPLNRESKQSMVIAFDRVELYELRKGSLAGSRFSRLIGGILFTVGIILSPLTWWNDPFINIPISYFIAELIRTIYPQLFMAAFVIVYWMTNVLGFLSMHAGSNVLLRRENKENQYLSFILISLFYTLIILILSQINFIQSPLEYLKNLP